MNVHQKIVKVQFLLAIMLMGESTTVFASNYTVQADFLYKFAQYVNWPRKQKKLNFCILGQNHFGNILKNRIKNKKINEKTLHFTHINSVSSLKSCHILYLSKNQKKNMAAVVKSRGILTVSEIKGFTKRGGMIYFFTKNKRVKFTINQSAALKAGIKIRSQLLKLQRK